MIRSYQFVYQCIPNYYPHLLLSQLPLCVYKDWYLYKFDYKILYLLLLEYNSCLMLYLFVLMCNNFLMLYLFVLYCRNCYLTDC